MLRIVLCLGSRYDVCECNSLREMTIYSFFVTFDLHLWPSVYVKVTLTLISRCTLCSCTLVPGINFVGSIEFEIWTIICRNLNDVTMTSSPIRILSNSKTNLKRACAYLSDKLNFIPIGYKRAEIRSREVNRELWRKNEYYVTVTLTVDQRSPMWIGFERLQ